MSKSLNDLPEHLLKPHLRRIEPMPIQREDTQAIALRDPFQLSSDTMAVHPNALGLLQHFQGQVTLEQLGEQFKADPMELVPLLEQMDSLGLLWGPTAEQLEQEKLQQLKDSGFFPVGASASMGNTPEECAQRMDHWLEQVEDAEIEGRINGVLVPHLDYERGWPNYATGYKCLQGVEPPDRVVILGTNHMGLGDGVIMADLEFQTPMGTVHLDRQIMTATIDRLGPGLSKDQLDHLPEHSIQLQLPWIQHLFPGVPVVAFLVADPLVGLIEDDGSRVGTEEFVEGFSEVLQSAGGRTLVISSSDLSHVGPQFGEPTPVDDERRVEVEQHDREMMAKFIEADPVEFVSAMSWCGNSTRWCSIGSMMATLAFCAPSEVELLDYRQSWDQDKGHWMVTSASMALVDSQE